MKKRRVRYRDIKPMVLEKFAFLKDEYDFIGPIVNNDMKVLSPISYLTAGMGVELWFECTRDMDFNLNCIRLKNKYTPESYVYWKSQGPRANIELIVDQFYREEENELEAIKKIYQIAPHKRKLIQIADLIELKQSMLCKYIEKILKDFETMFESFINRKDIREDPFGRGLYLSEVDPPKACFCSSPVMPNRRCSCYTGQHGFSINRIKLIRQQLELLELIDETIDKYKSQLDHEGGYAKVENYLFGNNRDISDPGFSSFTHLVLYETGKWDKSRQDSPVLSSEIYLFKDGKPISKELISAMVSRFIETYLKSPTKFRGKKRGKRIKL